MTLPIDRRYDWEAERRYLSRRIQEDQQRLAELDEILATFFAKAAA